MVLPCFHLAKLLQLRRFATALKPLSLLSCSTINRSLQSPISFSMHLPQDAFECFYRPHLPMLCRSYCSQSSILNDAQEGPAVADYRSLLQEDKYHKLAERTIHHLLEKLEEYGETVDIDDFDIDYGNEVLTLKLGTLGTYVINKQTPNRQIWLSSPLSGPSRFDWDMKDQTWVYRRTKANLYSILENELQQLCGVPISLT